MGVTDASWMWEILVIYLEKILDGDESGQALNRLSRGMVKSPLLEIFKARLGNALSHLI